MLNTAGLDLAKSPAIGVPLAFFMAAPPFALAAGLLVALGDEAALLSRWTPTALAATHLLLLGFVTPIMCGSLLQLLPVLVGAPTRLTSRSAVSLTCALGLGVALLASGLGLGQHAWLLAGAALTAAALLLFVFRILGALTATPAGSRLRGTLALATAALGVTALLGLLLVATRSGWLTLGAGRVWTDIHLAWGLAGWMGLLLLAVAGQLLPMFYLAPPPPDWLSRRSAPAVIGLLALLPFTTLCAWGTPLAGVLSAGILLLFSGFAIAAFRSQAQRRRPRRDPTLGFWWLGQASILLAATAWLSDRPAALIGILLIVGAGLSFTTGTLFKIVPFLSWYHLQSRKVALRRSDIKLPTMREFIPDAAARGQLLAHGTALLLLALGSWLRTPTVRAGALLLAVSALWLWFNLGRAWWRYRGVRRLLLAGHRADELEQ